MRRHRPPQLPLLSNLRKEASRQGTRGQYCALVPHDRLTALTQKPRHASRTIRSSGAIGAAEAQKKRWPGGAYAHPGGGGRWTFDLNVGGTLQGRSGPFNPVLMGGGRDPELQMPLPMLPYMRNYRSCLP